MEYLKNKLSAEAYDKLIQSNVTSLDQIICSRKNNLCDLMDVDYATASHIVQLAADYILKDKIQTVSLSPTWRYIKTGCDSIDSITRGGIPASGITEIVGPSGVGKTQLCLSLSLNVQLPPHLGGLNKGAVYICTEDVFPSKRLFTLVAHFAKKYNIEETTQFTDNVFVSHASDFEELKQYLYVYLPQLLRLRNIGLIVIDSIAGLFRSGNDEVCYINRSQDFVTLISKLNELIDKHELVVICVNQVTYNTEQGTVEPCLGLAWSNLITRRFNLTRINDSLIREFNVTFSPDLPNKKSSFCISEEGLVNCLNS